MVAQLLRIDDPRSKLEKANRDELYDYAKAEGVTEITEDMPAIMMRGILKAKGKVNINIPNRPLGSNPGVVAPDEEPIAQESVPVVSAEDDLMRQFLASKATPKTMTMGEMRAELKRRGIKMSRTDTMATLKEKLDGQSPA